MEKKSSIKDKIKMVLIMLIIVLLCVLAVIVIHTVKNFIYITDMENKISKYADSNNFHLEVMTINNDGLIVTTNIYVKGDKKACFTEREKDEAKQKVLMYQNGEITNTYVENINQRNVNLGLGSIVVQFFNATETDNFWQKLLASVMADIKVVNEDGKECYKLTHTFLPYTMNINEDTYLIEKETGLIYKYYNDDLVSRREYTFNNVDDSIFIEPNSSEYNVL